MSSLIIHVIGGSNKRLINPIPANYEIGLLSINFRLDQSKKETYFELTCNEIEFSPISRNVLRNILIKPPAFGLHCSEYRFVEYHDLINTNTSYLSFQWPNFIKVSNFTLHCRQKA